jgi:hypothetical protein
LFGLQVAPFWRPQQNPAKPPVSDDIERPVGNEPAPRISEAALPEHLARFCCSPLFAQDSPAQEPAIARISVVRPVRTIRSTNARAADAKTAPPELAEIEVRRPPGRIKIDRNRFSNRGARGRGPVRSYPFRVGGNRNPPAIPEGIFRSLTSFLDHVPIAVVESDIFPM